LTAPITNVTAVSLPEMITPARSTDQSGEFQKLLLGNIEKLETLSHDASTAAQKFITGEDEELHTAVLATQKASLAFELGLQVRNKVVDAYQEIMKMQI